MPDQEFQDRLQRIAQNKPAGPAQTGQAPTANSGGPNLSKMVVSVIVIFIGAGLARFANENYELLKADGGLGLALGVGLGAIATVISGMVLFWRSVRNRPAPASQLPEPPSASGNPLGRAGSVTESARGPNLVLMVVGVLVTLIGGGLIRFANENYETLRADGGVGLSLGIGLGAFATLIFGVLLFWRSLRKRPAQVSYTSEPLPVSKKVRWGPLLFGLALGVTACFSMLMASAARLLNPATDNLVSGLALLTALALTLLALLIGIIGLFQRGSALRRVPLYYLAGAILTYAAFRLLYLDLRNWPWFVSFVQ